MQVLVRVTFAASGGLHASGRGRHPSRADDDARALDPVSLPAELVEVVALERVGEPDHVCSSRLDEVTKHVGCEAGVTAGQLVERGPVEDLMRLYVATVASMIVGTPNAREFARTVALECCPRSPNTSLRKSLKARIPNAELELMPGAGHAPWMDDPDHVEDRVGAFLRA